nr:substrate-binding domain-containing protein [Luteimicrobium album]
MIAANDVVAFALVGELARRGVRVPDDVSVIGFDGLDLGARSNPRLTTIRQPIDAMGEIALQLASRLIAGDPAEHIVLEPSLLVRDSTRAVTS